MSAKALKDVIDFAITNPEFRAGLLINPGAAVDSENALNVSSADLTTAEQQAIKSMKVTDLDTLASLKAGLSAELAQHTGGVIL